MNTTAAILNTEDIIKGPLAASPLAHPLTRLAEDLNALVRDGHFQGVELDLQTLDCLCFLLRVAPSGSQFYVELFLGDLDDTFLDNEEVPLCVLMNWMGSDTEPAFWETETCQPGTDSSEPDFGEVLSLILLMTAAQEADTRQANH